MKLLILLALISLSYTGHTQIPAKAKTIIVKNVSFTDACIMLLDKGYLIERKHNDLQTATTATRPYPSTWNAEYIVSIRIKDSSLYITGNFTSPAGASDALFKNDPLYYLKAKKSLIGYGFNLLNEFALAFNKPVEYSL